MTDVIDAQALLPGMPGVPPLLYVSPEVGDTTTDQLFAALIHMGLPPIAVTVGGGQASMELYMAQDDRWRMVIGAGREVEVRMPWPDGGDLALVGDITVTDPSDWCGEVLEQGQALVMAGPALPWKRGEMSFGRLLSLLATRSACGGVVRAQLAA
ncbi:hypothetical protein GCM10010412_100970 [Nonomuraea recticatena]|uniref:Uncharacterized protein n=1 Tax=Nonomuraea recticatena TaxID=46178 RepID=A0ABP6FVB8_9ACTN